MTAQHGERAEIRVDVTGVLLGTAADRLRSALGHVITHDRPDHLHIDLSGVRSLGDSGLYALLWGYTTAIEYGTAYRVTGAHGAALAVLRTTGTLEVLADSDDLGALLLATITR
jgi:anti-anti-sigma regulatory factor